MLPGGAAARAYGPAVLPPGEGAEGPEGSSSPVCFRPLAPRGPLLDPAAALLSMYAKEVPKGADLFPGPESPPPGGRKGGEAGIFWQRPFGLFEDWTINFFL